VRFSYLAFSFFNGPQLPYAERRAADREGQRRADGGLCYVVRHPGVCCGCALAVDAMKHGWLAPLLLLPFGAVISPHCEPARAATQLLDNPPHPPTHPIAPSTPTLPPNRTPPDQTGANWLRGVDDSANTTAAGAISAALLGASLFGDGRRAGALTANAAAAAAAPRAFVRIGLWAAVGAWMGHAAWDDRQRMRELLLKRQQELEQRACLFGGRGSRGRNGCGSGGVGVGAFSFALVQILGSPVLTIGTCLLFKSLQACWTCPPIK